MEEEAVDPNRSGVGGGDVVRDCAVVEYVLSFFILSSVCPSSLLSSVHIIQGEDLPLLLSLCEWKADNQTPTRPM